MSTSSSVTQKNLDTNAEALKKEDKVLSEFDIQDERPKSLLWESAFVGVLCSAQLMTQAGLGQSLAPLHVIGNSFGTTNAGQLSWFASAYSLTVGTFILIAGRLGDIFGHKKFFVLGFFWYALWSLLAGFSAYSNQIFLTAVVHFKAWVRPFCCQMPLRFSDAHISQEEEKTWSLVCLVLQHLVASSLGLFSHPCWVNWRGGHGLTG